MIAAVLHSKTTIRLLPHPLRKIALHAYAHSLSVVWIGCGFLGMVTLASAWFIQEKEMGPVRAKRLKGKGKGEQERGGAGNEGSRGVMMPPDGTV